MTYFTEGSTIVKNYKYPESAFFSHNVTIPLIAENSTAFKPIVSVGDKVEEGQIIATAENGTNLHASIPGTIIGINPCYHPTGKQYYGIEIKFGGQFKYVGRKITPKKSEDFILTSSEITASDFNPIINKLITSNVLNTFDIAKPENAGMQIKQNHKAKNLVVRLFDEDNFRYTDSLISKFFFPELLEAAKTLLKAFNGDGILFALNAKAENKDELLKNSSDTINFVGMNTKRYPSGTKREICSAFNRNLRKNSKLQITKNDIFIDASSLYEVYKVLNLNTPSISRYVFLGGNCLKASVLLDVKIGTKFIDLVNQIGGFSKEPKKIIVNGLITGTTNFNLEVPVTQFVKSITFISKDKTTDKQIYPCINCGNCRFVCPVKLSPDIIYNNMRNFKELPEYLKKTSIVCTNCGLCNINCPSRLPLSQTISYLRNSYLQEKEKNPNTTLGINNESK